MLDRHKFRVWSKENLKRMISYEILRDASGGIVKVANKAMEKHEVNSLPEGLFLPFGDDDLVFMQCTGIEDKNGQLIFESDILTSSEYPFQKAEGKYNYHAEVIWFEENASFGYVLKCVNSEVSGISHNISELFEERVNLFEVLGNIYENPELLGGE